MLDALRLVAVLIHPHVEAAHYVRAVTNHFALLEGGELLVLVDSAVGDALLSVSNELQEPLLVGDPAIET